MECADIRSVFVAGRVPAGPAVDEHLARCPHCRELLDQDARVGRHLALAVLPPVEPGELFEQLSAQLAKEVGVRAKLRELPTPARAGALVGAVGLLLLMTKALLGVRPDLPAYSPVIFWSVVGVFCAAVLFGAFRMERGTSSPLRSTQRDGTYALALLVLPTLVALVSPLGAPLAARSQEAWGSSLGCFGYGALAVTPLLALAWLFERRDSVPLSVLLMTGALSGIAANLLLHTHCASAHLGHLLLGHASVSLAWALGLVAFSGRSARARTS